MRIRPLATLSLVAAAAIVLAGCSGDPAPADSASTGGASGCEAPVPEGEAAASVTVSGEVGTELSVSFPDDFAATQLERALVTEADGEEIEAGAVIRGNFTVIDPATGEVVLDSLQENPQGMDIVVNGQQIFGAALQCAPLGSRTVTLFPAGSLGQGSPGYVLVADAVEELPSRATGADVAPAEGLPTVALDEDGAPTITVPGGEAPTDVVVANLKQGDGETVRPGDQVIVQYTGALWDGGTVFDSSWDRGTPAQFATTGVVTGFQQALEGQQIGSQVIVVVPPAFGYGDQEKPNIPAGSTLVFVVDILGVQHAATS